MGLLRGSSKGSRPTLPPRPTGFSRQPLGGCSPRLCRLGLGVLGRVRHHRQPRRAWIVRLASFHGGIDDGGSGELALSVASSHPLLDFPEDVGHVEVPLPAPVTSAGDLQRAAASAMEEPGPDARHGPSCPDHRKPTTNLPGPARRLALIAPSG